MSGVGALLFGEKRGSPTIEEAELVHVQVHKKEASKFCAWQNGEVSLP